jgi:KUP system potassium uptake protein
MVSLVALLVWRNNIILVLFFFLVFGSLDGVYLSSVLRKVPDGAWFTLLLALILSTIFILWRWGKEQQWAAEARYKVTPSQLLQPSTASSLKHEDQSTRAAPQLSLNISFGGGSIITAPGLSIFFDKVGGGPTSIPKVFTQFVRKFRTHPEVTVFFHMRPLSQPTVSAAEQFVCLRAVQAIPSCYFVTLRHGYTDDVLTADLGRKVIKQLRHFVMGESTTNGGFSESVRRELDALERAEAAQVVYVTGKQVMRIRRGGGNVVARGIRRFLLEVFLWIRENSRAKLADLNIDPDNLVEVGFVEEI